MFKYIKSIWKTNRNADYTTLYSSNPNAFFMSNKKWKKILHYSYVNQFSEMVLLC